MAFMNWTNDLNTGVDEIDKQHQRIVQMINELHTASNLTHEQIGGVIEELVDYTLSHFAFEEALMEDANYTFYSAHKRVHELFTRRVSEYKMRFDAGEDVTDDLKSLLSRWLFNHIRNDDAAYAPTVLDNLRRKGGYKEKSDGGFIGRLRMLFFGR